MSELSVLRNASNPTPVVAIVGGAVAGSEAAAQCVSRGAIAVVFEQGTRPYGKIEDGLPRWHFKLRDKEYARINGNLKTPGVLFVPATEIGRDISWATLRNAGFSSIVLANGAWRDRLLPVEGADAFIDKGLVYQNPFVYWFNHYEESDYKGPSYDIADNTIVIGGGLASIDVAKIINLELYARALRDRGIDIEIVELEVKGIPRVLEANGLSVEDLGINGCALYYRRSKEDMPLASLDNPTEEQKAKLRVARAKIMDRVIRKYLVKFEALSRPVATIVENDRLVGMRFQRTEIVDGRVRGIEGSEHDVRAPMVISSIGSTPKAIPDVPTKGELYDFADWSTGELAGLTGVFGLGNVLTGKGNIKDSRNNALDIIERIVSAYLGVGKPAGGETRSQALSSDVLARIGQGKPTTRDAMHAIAHQIEARWREIGYSDFDTWIAQRH